MNHREESNLFGKGAGVTKALLLIYLILSFSNLFSQQIISRDIIDYPSGSISSQCGTEPFSGCIITLTPVKYGESYSFTIPTLPTFSRSDVNFIISQKNKCSEGSVIFTPDGKIEIESTNSCKPQNSNFIAIEVKATSGNLIDSIQYLLPIKREPVKVVLALDKSGSMSLPLLGGTKQRWEVLKSSMDLFTQKLQVFRLDGDQIGLTYFSTNTLQPNSPINAEFIDITSEASSVSSSSIVNNDIASREPASGTALGKGLLNAKQKLGDNNPINARKVVLLFTDGLQNVEPFVNPDGVTLSSGEDFLNFGPCNTSDSIRYYTVGMGGNNLAPETLGKIAQASGGVPVVFTPSTEESDLDYLIQNQIVHIFGGGSPQIVSRKTGVFSSNGTTHSFPINGNVSKLYFELTSANVSGINIKIEKDGKDLTSIAKISESAYYKSYSFSLPIITPEIVNTKGDWLLTVNGNSSNRYSLVCYVDDHFLNFNCNLIKSVQTVGDRLILNAKLAFAGKPLSGGTNKIQAIILKPGDDIGDLLAQGKGMNEDSLIDVMTGADTKLFNLLQTDKAFNKKLIPTSHSIDLEDEGNGTYSASYDNTELSGVYQILFTANGEIPGFGNFERQKLYSAVFKFGQINASKSSIKATISSKMMDKNENIATVTFKPKNDFGYCLGPGFLSRIKLSVDSNQGKVTSSKDNLDGSYTFIISSIPNNTKPDLKIMVMDEILYLGKFPSPRLYLWQFLVLAALVIALIVRLIFAHTGQQLLRFVLWILLILWILFMILQRLGIVVI